MSQRDKLRASSFTGRAVLEFQRTETPLKFRPAWRIVAGIPVVVHTDAEPAVPAWRKSWILPRVRGSDRDILLPGHHDVHQIFT